MLPLSAKPSSSINTSKSFDKAWVGSANIGYSILEIRFELSFHALWTKWVSVDTE